MTGTGRHTRSKLRSSGYMMGAAAGRQLRAQILPLTPRVIFRALLGVFLFLCGIVFGVWLIIRFRRHVQDSSPELSRLRQTHRVRQLDVLAYRGQPAGATVRGLDRSATEAPLKARG